jgi:hypothetical protein
VDESRHMTARPQLIVDQGRAKQAALDRIPRTLQQVSGPSALAKLAASRRATGRATSVPPDQTWSPHLPWTTQR